MKSGECYQRQGSKRIKLNEFSKHGLKWAVSFCRQQWSAAIPLSRLVTRGSISHPQTPGTAVWRLLGRDLLQHKTRPRFPEPGHKPGALGYVIAPVL